MSTKIKTLLLKLLEITTQAVIEVVVLFVILKIWGVL